MTLPSNVKSSITNGLANYETVLAKPIQLDGNWKVGLTEIQFTNSWHNVKEGSSKIEIVVSDAKGGVGNRLLQGHVPPGRYDEIQELIDVIVSKFTPSPSIKSFPKLTLVPYARRLKHTEGEMTDSKESNFLQLSGDAADILGYDLDKLEPQRSGMYTHVPYDLAAGIHSIYVYCDVVEYSFVGDMCVQLLRSVKVPSSSKFGDNVNVTFDRPYYMPLNSKEVSRILISLKDDSGELIDFKFGRSEITLHFIRDE